jgi:hypothetical protein
VFLALNRLLRLLKLSQSLKPLLRLPLRLPLRLRLLAASPPLSSSNFVTALALA